MKGRTLMSGRLRKTRLAGVPQFLLHHRHTPADCGVVFAAFSGFASPLRHGTALASCRSGGHEIWWPVAAADEAAALRMLPGYVATTCTATRIDEVAIP
jgi:hypothetical protein